MSTRIDIDGGELVERGSDWTWTGWVEGRRWRVEVRLDLRRGQADIEDGPDHVVERYHLVGGGVYDVGRLRTGPLEPYLQAYPGLIRRIVAALERD